MVGLFPFASTLIWLMTKAQNNSISAILNPPKKRELVKEGSYLVWRGELTKEIASEVLECDGDML